LLYPEERKGRKEGRKGEKGRKEGENPNSPVWSNYIFQIYKLNKLQLPIVFISQSSPGSQTIENAQEKQNKSDVTLPL
jgi:hypothetical protein